MYMLAALSRLGGLEKTACMKLGRKGGEAGDARVDRVKVDIIKAYYIPT